MAGTLWLFPIHEKNSWLCLSTKMWFKYETKFNKNRERPEFKIAKKNYYKYIRTFVHVNLLIQIYSRIHLCQNFDKCHTMVQFFAKYKKGSWAVSCCISYSWEETGTFLVPAAASWNHVKHKTPAKVRTLKSNS